ncbi:type 4a pilus biogenesis protein PilO [Patescibacteria group bacterium]|nr:type 4a pilus biogenesis protein PilO [Patescibacteria group bacterium]MBU1703031.1 type 4a pilus biogenesis protein PilO [Patescibacteria group bacterium]MBU1953921.1 type 4a pilus biogenesis protein PilO [Patescibacteria group bacterium]
MENPINQKRGSGLSAIALVLLIVAFVAAWFYVKPQWEEVSGMSKGRDELLTERQNASDKLVELQKLQQELSSSSEVSQETTLAAIPEKLEQEKLIRDLSDIAQKNNMLLGSINFGIGQTSTDSGIDKVQVNLNVTGSQSDLISFLRGLEGSSRKLVVKNIAVQLGEAALGSRVNFNVSAEAYYQGSI